MTGPEHYAEAEYQSQMAVVAWPGDRELAMYNLGQAQVHATLALAAATALFQDEGWKAVAGQRAGDAA